ncbi:MAG: Wadjet anti-phage system protein JetD domain-containing protein [Brotaphodocola sp.]
MKRISLEELAPLKQNQTYRDQYQTVKDLIDQGAIQPVKASGTNGKKPALFREYWLIEEKKNYDILKEELKYQMTPLICVDYYLKHPDVYEEDRRWVLLLNHYLKNSKEKLDYPLSVNERSFEIWKREKFLSKEQGKTILKHCGLEEKYLNMYGTTEPLAYYSHTRDVPQKLLIIENKDTFYSMRRHLLDGKSQILGESVGTLIYGAGKGILKSFRDFDLCVEPYMKVPENEILYFGDLDYEGIGIYESLAEMFENRWTIKPFIAAYDRMLEKAQGLVQSRNVITEDKLLTILPDTKEGQIRRDCTWFFSYFDEAQVQKMREILEKGKYIPQEILNISDFYP